MSDLNVVQIESVGSNPDVVRLLEEALRMCKDKKVTGIAMVLNSRDELFRACEYDGDFFAILGGVVGIQAEMVKEMSGD